MASHILLTYLTCIREAEFYGLKPPIPYELSNCAANHSEHGMNFAYGATGVFDTPSTSPNMTIQIDYLERLTKKKVYNHTDLESSVALVAVSGNDYLTFLARNSTNATGWKALITKVVNQIVVNVKRIQALGVKKIAVDVLQPVGSIPSITSVHLFTYCNNTMNKLVFFRNFLLKQAVATLKNETKEAAYIYLVLYTAFDTILENHGRHQGRNEFENTLNPCCKGTSSEYDCGSVDANGVKQYTLCEQPDSSFFWDMFHPTQAAWLAVASTLRTSLRQL